MAYTVLTESDLFELAPEDAQGSRAEQLAGALDAMEGRGFALAAVDRPAKGEACYVFTGGERAGRLNNIR